MLKDDETLSKLAFKCKLRHYTVVVGFHFYSDPASTLHLYQSGFGLVGRCRLPPGVHT